MNHTTLIIPDKPDVERDAVAAAWRASGGDMLRVDRFWVRPDVAPERVALYGPDTFCLVIAQLLGLNLLSPPDDLLLKAAPVLTWRRIRGTTLSTALDGPFPLFAKPLQPKQLQFRARVWGSAQELSQECAGLAPETAIIVAEVVEIAAEARAWVMDGRVATCAVYDGTAAVDAAAAFVAYAAAELALPEVCVVDCALVDGTWCLLEANAAWGAGLNGCDASAVVPCIDRATRIAEGP